jgi:putative transposase
VFAGQSVGIREVADQVWLVSFMHYDLGIFDNDENRMEPVGHNPSADRRRLRSYSLPGHV